MTIRAQFPRAASSMRVPSPGSGGKDSSGARPTHNRERGQSLIEFAIGMIVAFVLLAGVLDFGRALYLLIKMREAAIEGAVYGSIDPTDPASIRTRVRESSSLPIELASLADDQIDIDVVGSACAGNEIRVQIEIPFIMAMPFFNGSSIMLRASAADTILIPLC